MVAEQNEARAGGSYGSAAISGMVMRNFTLCRSGIASTVPSCMSAILRTIARPKRRAVGQVGGFTGVIISVSQYFRLPSRIQTGGIMIQAPVW